MNRTEKDTLGEVGIPESALYGIHAARARNNFPGDIPFHIEWYRAIGLTKLAVYTTYRKFKKAAVEKMGDSLPFDLIPDEILTALEEAAREVSEGLYYSHFIVPAIQGGAGTGINMNINEIITNAALISLNHKAGEYDKIHPIEQTNIYQSANDVIPTSLTVAAMKLLQELEDEINNLRQQTEKRESESRNKPRLAYTQMQEAVPSTFGSLFSIYNESLSRDWWRVSRCLERIKVVNLGGGATGTGVSIPRFFIMEVVPELRNICSIPVARSENLQDATANLDPWVEVHATLKAHAVNLEKMASDLRLLSSDISRSGLLKIPDAQAGSSIMPGKVNPVIPEFVISVSNRVYSNDSLISSLAGKGCLDLNPYIPLIGHSFLESIKILIAANRSLTENLMEGLQVDFKAGYDILVKSPALTTALNPYIGYDKAREIARVMKEESVDIFEAARLTGMINTDNLKKILEPANLTKLGFTLSDLEGI